MANKLTITYNGNALVNKAIIPGDADVVYNKTTIESVKANQTKTLKCAGKVMETDCVIGGKTLKCLGKQMATNVVIEVIEGKIVVYESGKRSLSAGTIVSGTTYSKNYSFTNNAIRIGAGEAGKVSIQGVDFSDYSTLYFEAWANTAEENPTTSFYYVGYGNTKSPTDSSSGKVTKVPPTSRKTISFDIKNVSGQKYIYLGCNVSGGAYVDVYNIWLE